MKLNCISIEPTKKASDRQPQLNSLLAFFVCGGHSTSFNALGSNIVLTDDNQNVLVRYEYDVLDAIRNETGTSDNTRKLTGKEFYVDSNLYYYAARYYDPYIGRFTQRDPIGDGVKMY